MEQQLDRARGRPVPGFEPSQQITISMPASPSLVIYPAN